MHNVIRYRWENLERRILQEEVVDQKEKDAPSVYFKHVDNIKHGLIYIRNELKSSNDLTFCKNLDMVHRIVHYNTDMFHIRRRR